MPTLRVLHPDGTETEHRFEGELSIGRHEACGLVLPDGGVSRRHALLRAEDGGVVLEDAGSANGTYVEGIRLYAPCVLAPGLEVQLGDYVLRLAPPPRPGRSARTRTDELPHPDTARTDEVPAGSAGEGAGPADLQGLAGAADAETGSPVLASPGETAGSSTALAPGGAAGVGHRGRTSRTDELPETRAAGLPGGPEAALAVPEEEEEGPRLIGLSGPWTGRRFALVGTLGVGRSAGSQVLLEDESVSRRHAELQCTSEGVRVRDLGSANGTRVNGQPVDGHGALLEEGDAVQFGVGVFRFEGGPERPLHRGEGHAVPPRRRARHAQRLSETWAGLAPRQRLAVAGAGLLVLLLLGALVKGLSGPAPEGAEVAVPGVDADAGEQVQQWLGQCRSLASTGLDAEPDWQRAEAACGRALDLEPLQPEAHAQLQRIRLEREASDHFARGERALARLKDEEALDWFGKIPKESDYFLRARARVREASGQVVMRALDDCKRYLRERQWSAAAPRCERYFGVACQRMSREELEPPVGHEVVLAAGRLRANEWRPRDPLYLRFLTARQRVDPHAGPWTCPPADMLAEEPEGPDPKEAVAAAFQQRYADRLLQAAMMDYWSGRSAEAVSTLQKLRSDSSRAPLHSAADAALRDLSTVDQLFKAGQSALQAEDPERAAAPFHEALELDGRLMAELATTRPSFYRRAIQQDMASAAYAAGKHWADRQDARRGCRVWKLGFGFYAGNTDLNKAVGFCSTRGLALLKEAKDCADLPAVLELAVKGDGLQEKVDARRAEWGCR